MDNLSEAEKQDYERYIKIKRIRENELDTAKTDGYKEAEDTYKPMLEQERKQREEAAKQAEEERKQREALQRKTARELKAAGLPADKIAEITGLSQAEVKQL